MRLEKFQVKGLFDLYNHTLDFTKEGNATQNESEGASVIMIYGRNGVQNIRTSEY